MTLERAMRQVLAEMALLQYGSTTSWNPSGTGKADSRPPSGDARPMAAEWAERWERDPSETTLTAARDALDAYKRRQAPAEGDGSSEEQWIITDGEGFSADQVARKFNTTPTRVRRLRLKHDRESEYGVPTSLPRGRDKVPDARERVMNLARQGCTLSQIKMQTNVPRETVRRWMKEAA